MLIGCVEGVSTCCVECVSTCCVVGVLTGCGVERGCCGCVERVCRHVV